MSQRNVIVVSGVSGTGKSCFGRRLAINDKKLTARFFFDAEFSERDPSKGEFADWLNLPSCRDGEDIMRQIPTGYCCFDPHALFAGQLEEAVKIFCDLAYEVSATIPGEKLIIIPEVWRYCRPQGIPKELANIVQSGRRRRLRLLVDTQEPNRLNSSILNGVREWVTFKLQGELALNEVKQVGFDVEEVKGLEPFQLIGRDLDTNSELRGRLKL